MALCERSMSATIFAHSFGECHEFDGYTCKGGHGNGRHKRR